MIVKKWDKEPEKLRWDDAYLLRFLRARKFNIDETSKMWKKFIDWRVEKDVDNVLVLI